MILMPFKYLQSWIAEKFWYRSIAARKCLLVIWLFWNWILQGLARSYVFTIFRITKQTTIKIQIFSGITPFVGLCRWIWWKKSWVKTRQNVLKFAKTCIRVLWKFSEIWFLEEFLTWFFVNSPKRSKLTGERKYNSLI